MRAFAFIAAFASAGAAAQEIVTLAPRAGVTQSFVILGMEGRQPDAVVLLYIGAGGRGSCEPLSAHGYFGKEALTVDAIAAWMLKKPFPMEVE